MIYCINYNSTNGNKNAKIPNLIKIGNNIAKSVIGNPRLLEIHYQTQGNNSISTRKMSIAGPMSNLFESIYIQMKRMNQQKIT
jgi:hypothetical protein